jgi:Ca2+-binding EF-hand superfamily protein
MGDDQTDREK